MQAVKAYYDGRAFVPTIPVSVKTNRMAIVTILDDEIIEPETKESDKSPSKEFFKGSADWLEHPIKIDSFTPLSREEANERTHIY